MEGFLVAAVLGVAAVAILAWRRARDRPAGRSLAEASRSLSLVYRPGGLLRPHRAAGRHGGRPVSITAGAPGVTIRLGWSGSPARGETLLRLSAPPPVRWPPIGLEPAFETRIGVQGGIGAARLVLAEATRREIEGIAGTAGDFRLEIAAPRWSGWGVLSLRVPGASAADYGALLGRLGSIAGALERNPAF